MRRGDRNEINVLNDRRGDIRLERKGLGIRSTGKLRFAGKKKGGEKEHGIWWVTASITDSTLILVIKAGNLLTSYCFLEWYVVNFDLNIYSRASLPLPPVAEAWPRCSSCKEQWIDRSDCRVIQC